MNDSTPPSSPPQPPQAARNKGKLTGPKPPLRPGHVWSIRAKLQLERRTRDLALFNIAIDSKLRGCDLVALRVDDVAPNGYAVDRATVRQSKTGRPVRFELTEVTRHSLDDYLRDSGRGPGQCLFPGRRGPDEHLTTRQYARLVSEWVSGIGLDPLKYATHSMRRTKATLIYRRTGISVQYNYCSGVPHTAREHPREAQVHYPFHPQFGETVIVRRRLVTNKVEMAVILQPDSSLALLPAWMLDESAARFTVHESPTFSLAFLQSLPGESGERYFLVTRAAR